MKKKIYIEPLRVHTAAADKRVNLFVQNGKAFYVCSTRVNGKDNKEVKPLNLQMSDDVAAELKKLAKVNASCVWVDYVPQKSRLTPKTYEFIYNCWEQIVAAEPDWF